jgi:hypothetical protein
VDAPDPPSGREIVLERGQHGLRILQHDTTGTSDARNQIMGIRGNTGRREQRGRECRTASLIEPDDIGPGGYFRSLSHYPRIA